MDDTKGRNRDGFDIAVQAALSAIPYVGGPLTVFAEHERERFQRREAEFAAALLAETEESELAAVIGDERRAALITRAAIGAGITDWAEKRRLLATVASAVANGDDADIDESDLLVTALLDLDRPHIACLVRLAKRAEPVLPSELQPPAHPSALAGLSRHGLIETAGIDGGNGFANGGLKYMVTDFGRSVLESLNADPGPNGGTGNT